MAERLPGDNPPPPKKWITPGEAVAALAGAAVGGLVDAAIYWVVRPDTYVAVLGIVGAVVGVAVYTARKGA